MYAIPQLLSVPTTASLSAQPPYVRGPLALQNVERPRSPLLYLSSYRPLCSVRYNRTYRSTIVMSSLYS